MATTFNFLALPFDLRYIVLEHYFSDSSVLCYHKQRKELRQVVDDVATFRLRHLSPTAMHILGVCRQLRAEALPIYNLKTTFAYALQAHGHPHLPTVLNLIQTRKLSQLRKLSFPYWAYNARVLAAFPNLRTLEFGEAMLRSPRDAIRGFLPLDACEGGWSVSELVRRTKNEFLGFEDGGNDPKSMHLKFAVQMPGRSFKVTCCALVGVPVKIDESKGGYLLVAMCFDWNSGKLLQKLQTIEPEDEGLLQYIEGGHE